MADLGKLPSSDDQRGERRLWAVHLLTPFQTPCDGLLPVRCGRWRRGKLYPLAKLIACPLF